MNYAMESNPVPKLNTAGFVTYSFDDYSQSIDNFSSLKFSMYQFMTSYDRLPPDAYMNDGGNYRFRRFARFMLDTKNNELTQLDSGVFYQSKMVNQLNGGIVRSFPEMETEHSGNLFLKNMIQFHANELPKNKNGKWIIYVHQIRIVACSESKGIPTPEGIHQDGHNYVAQIFLSRKNVSGGKSMLFDSNKLPLFETTMINTLDTILIDDKVLYHYVTPIMPDDPDQVSYRDMLLIDFNLTGENL